MDTKLVPQLRLALTAIAAGLIVISSLSLAAGGAYAADEKKSYILGTASTGGTYYPVGVALGTLTKVKLEPQTGISLSAISTGGTADNVKLLREDQIQFGLIQGIYGAWAARGTGPLKELGPQKHLRAITGVWPNVEHWIVRNAAVESGTLADLENLQGSKLSIGARNSGTEGSARTMLSGLGYNVDTFFDVAYLNINATVDAIQDGNVQVANLGAGLPIGGVSQLYASGADITILNVTDEQIKKINSEFELWTRYEIPAETYPGQAKVISTVAQPNLVVVRADVPDEVVYQITKTIFENLSFLHNIHPATTHITLESALKGLPMPLHRGALRYYQEIGIDVPDRLIATE